MSGIKKISFFGKKVLLRVDFNVPLDKGLCISNDTRIREALPTIKKILNTGGRVIILSHLGRPKNGFEERFSLKHIVKHLSLLLKKPVDFCDDCLSKKTFKHVNSMKNGEIVVLENIRFYSEEKTGCVFFAKKLSRLGDLYVNDAFGTAHRKHASTSIIANYFPNKKYFGLLLEKEIQKLEKAVKNPKRPLTAIIGGAKISGKIDVISALFDQVDNLIIGGGMAYTFIKALGGNVGDSLVEETKLDLAKKLIHEAKEKEVQMLLPCDSINASSFSNNATKKNSDIQNIQKGFMGLDIGLKSIDVFKTVICNSKTIIWNGPMGVFEMENFSEGTKKIGGFICEATKNGAFSLVGGGDSVSALEKFNLTQDVSYISTGGGAMLKYLEGVDLPAIQAILD